MRGTGSSQLCEIACLRRAFLSRFGESDAGASPLAFCIQGCVKPRAQMSGSSILPPTASLSGSCVEKNAPLIEWCVLELLLLNESCSLDFEVMANKPAILSDTLFEILEHFRVSACRKVERNHIRSGRSNAPKVAGY